MRNLDRPSISITAVDPSAMKADFPTWLEAILTTVSDSECKRCLCMLPREQRAKVVEDAGIRRCQEVVESVRSRIVEVIR